MCMENIFYVLIYNLKQPNINSLKTNRNILQFIYIAYFY